MAIKVKQRVNSSSDMLGWQYKTLLGEIQQVELHQTGDCPCILNTLEPQERCLGKHLLNISTLSSETAQMDSANSEWLLELAEEASERHEQFKSFICETKDLPELSEWARNWRKKHIEPVYYTCKVKVAKMHQAPKAKISDSCTRGTCSLKLKETSPLAEMNGWIYQNIIIKSEDRSKQVTLQAKIDTGAFYIYVPEDIKNQLGLRYANSDVPTRTFDGRILPIPMHHALIEINGREFATSVGTGEATIGVIGLEIYKLKPNPLTGKLEPATDLELWEMGQMHQVAKMHQEPKVRISGSCTTKDESKTEKLVENHCQGEANMYLASEKNPEVSKTQPNYNNLAEGQTIIDQAGDRWSIIKINKEGVPAKWGYTIKGEKIDLTRTRPLGEIERYYKIEQPLPVCTKAKAVKLEHCIMSVKERNVDKGCKPAGTGSKKCPSPFAVCQSSLKCKVKVH